MFSSALSNLLASSRGYIEFDPESKRVTTFAGMKAPRVTIIRARECVRMATSRARQKDVGAMEGLAQRLC